MRPHVAELSRIADTYTSCHPNAGLPNAFGGYDEEPHHTADLLRSFTEEGFVNIVGGGRLHFTGSHPCDLGRGSRDCPRERSRSVLRARTSAGWNRSSSARTPAS